MIELNKTQRENIGKFFIDIAKATVIGYVIAGIFGKARIVAILVGLFSCCHIFVYWVNTLERGLKK